jgi:hypothetical protein
MAVSATDACTVATTKPQRFPIAELKQQFSAKSYGR